MILEYNRALEVVSNLLSENRLSIFAGSGISIDSGLPSWDGLIDEYIALCETINNAVPDSCKFDSIIQDAKNYKTKNIIDTITALKEKIKFCQASGYNTDYYLDKLSSIFYSAHPNIYHELIISTAYNQIITTNYDTLLEKACEKLGYHNLLLKSFNYKAYKDISAAIYSRETAIIHAHGKITNINLDEFVLTKHDYINIMKHNIGFRYIINTIFITNSVLFVGYGGSDPHFEDIIDDLNLTLNWSEESSSLPKCYIMMKKDKATPIREFLNSSNRIDIIAFDDYPQMIEFLKELQTKFPRPKF